MAAVKVETVDEAEKNSILSTPMGIFDPTIKIKTEPIDSECENSDTEGHSQVFDQSFEDVLNELPEVQRYINQLKASIIRQQLKLDKLHKKVKKLKKRNKNKKHAAIITNASTQTGEDDLPQESAISSTLPTEVPRPAPLSGPGTNYMSTLSDELPTTGANQSILDKPVAWVVGDSESTSGSGTLSLAEQVKQAAQSAMRNTSFVYEPNSGMYYDYGTGYYYNAEMGLYYDGNTGKYMYYDENTKSYIFHSQVEVFKKTPVTTELHEATSSVVPAESFVPKKVKPIKIKVEKVKVEKVKIKKEKVVNSGNESQEEGECSDSESSAQSSDRHESEDETEELVVPTTVWPPCMRIIVQETSVESLKVGTLFIVTCIGGSMGREGDHCVLIKDTGISKHHSKFTFNNDDGKYYVVDLGSRNGTSLNGKRISAALQESQPCEVMHGSVLIVGGTKLLCHIHSGSETCGHCEPGLIQKPQVKEKTYSYNAGGIGKEHRKELKRIRKKFGLTNIKSNANASMVAGYEDRALKRRVTIGSSHHEDKTKAASVHEAIAEDNKGFKMLSKMGWSKGEALGREGGDGIVEPVLVEQRGNKAGLGTTSPKTTPFQPAVERRKGEVWKKAQERYDKACTQDASTLLEGDDNDAEDNVMASLALQKVKKTNKRKDISPLSPTSPPREISLIDERKNSVWKKTQMRIKEKKTATPSPPRDDVEDV